MANRQDELKGLLLKALESPSGIILKIDGNEPGKRQSAITALTTAKRELMVDLPEMADLHIMKVPGREEEIAIRKFITE